MNTSLYILIFSVIITGVIADFFHKEIKQFNKYIIPFSISFVLALIFTHILPELYTTPSKTIGIFLVIGFVLQIILELLSKGIEHGHVHAPSDHKGWTLLLPLMIGLSLHSFIEGMPLISIDEPLNHEIAHHGHDHSHHNHSLPSTGSIYFIMIIAHKLPVAAILMVFFIKHLHIRWKRYALLCFFALTAPMGAWTGNLLNDLNINKDLIPILLAISTGMLLHIATLLVFEKHHEVKEKWSNILLIICGLTLGILLYS